ncbi:MAG TPA: sodium-translocating pyrophosphatase [Tepidisphaeraceae bacterium]|nr:sodium-translocating pyrophosphatase [Tepidisphaeraceae bacterium]
MVTQFRQRRPLQPGRAWAPLLAAAAAVTLAPLTARASEASLVLPNLNDARFYGIGGWWLLLVGMLLCIGGLVFGLVIYQQLKALPVHRSMLEVSELIYETCKTYLKTQGKFILLLWVFIAVIMVVYFGFLQDPGHQQAVGTATPAGTVAATPGDVAAAVAPGSPQNAPGTTHAGEQWPTAARVIIILLFSLIGIAGSYSVAWFGIRVNTFANSRTSMASLRGMPFQVCSIPLRAGMSIGMVLISVELMIMLMILLFLPATLAGSCFIGFAIGESLGAAVLRIAGGIFTKIADIGADLMKIVFKVEEDDARNPGVIADCVGDNAGDSVGPTADGFETYGVTGVALIVFIMLAVAEPLLKTQLLVWIFVMRVLMLVTSAASYMINESMARKKYAAAREMNFETPLRNLVWLTSVISILVTFVASLVLIPNLDGNTSLWWKLAMIISCGTLAGALIPELTTFFTSVHSRHVREIVNTSREGGASLNILSGLTAGNFSAFWIGGVAITLLMAVAYAVSNIGGTGTGLGSIMVAPAVFAFGLVAFGFLGMGPVTIAVDSYGPVTDNAQSVYELSLIEQQPNVEAELTQQLGQAPNFKRAKELLEENDGAGNTFKATAKPVLIGTAVVGATTLIFSIIMVLTDGLRNEAAIRNLSILHAPFLLGLIAGGGVIYWFSGASCQAVITGAYRAVEFIKRNMKLDGAAKASTEDSKRVVEICTKYAQSGMFNIFCATFFLTLSAAFMDPYFFIGFLIGIAIFGLFQAIFMANAGGAWDNAKKIVETELRMKRTPLHDATVVGDTVGDPFKDTSSVAMNPVIKFSTLFGLLAVELAITIQSPALKWTLAIVFAVIALMFVYRSFFGMRIQSEQPDARPGGFPVEAAAGREPAKATV